MRRAGISPLYSETITMQAEGPLQRFVRPIAHTLRSRFPHFTRSHNCHVTPRPVDFTRLLAAFMQAETAQELAEMIPPDILDHMW